MKDFAGGFRHLLKGFAFLAGRPRLWLWAILPTIINLLLLAIILVAFIHYYGDLYGWLSAHLGKIDIANPQSWSMHVLDAILWVVNLLFQLLIVLASLVLILIVAYAVGLVIAGPFNDALSERVEIIVTGTLPPPFTFKKFVRDTIRTIRNEAIKALVLIAIPTALFVLNIIPVIGGPLYVVMTFLFGAWDIGFSYADLPMGRRVLPLRERWAFARANRWALIGLGVGFAIPFFGLIFAAPMVVGGTLLYVEHSKASRT